MTDNDLMYDEAIAQRLGMQNLRDSVAKRIGPESEDACRSVERTLHSWIGRVDRLSANSYRPLHEGDVATVEEMSAYHYEREERARREKAEADQQAARYGLSDKDERPYFHDPMPLAFDPEESVEKLPRSDETALADVWSDPLARTLWLAIKARHLTSQYFNGACVEQAFQLRKNPPKFPDQLRATTGEAWSSVCSRWFNVQLYPYVVRILVDEGRWPYLPPPPDWIAPAVLSYTIPTKTS